jgi:uncharacterized protein (DUF58 family)
LTPSLTKRGKLILATAASFMLIGALNGASPLVAMGGVIIAAFFAAYLWFFPAAVLLRHRHIEIRWWMPPGDLPGGALSVDHHLPLHLALRNHGARRLRVLRVDVLATSAIDPPPDMEAVMPAGMQVEIVGNLRARQAGYHVLHGALLHFGDILGLFNITAYFPNPLPFKVFPLMSHIANAGTHRLQGSARNQRQGLHQVRQRGLAGELRELREHNHGDPFKNIAWKATAKHRKLMVRELENEIVRTHQFVVDIGSSMRGKRSGANSLNYAIGLVSSLSKLALDSGDRVGALTFDTRVYSQVPVGEGRHHYLKIIDRLIETNTIVDEDLTDLTNSELVAAVASYLSHQESVDVRIFNSPPLDAPDWAHIQAGPKGQLYDLNALDRIIIALLKSMGREGTGSKSAAPRAWWDKVHVGSDSPPIMTRLRLFARLRGLELPYRHDHEHGRRAHGLSQALNKVATGPRSDSTIIISDMAGLLEDPEVCIKDLARARRGGRQVIAIVPFSTDFYNPIATRPAQLVAEVLEREEQIRLDQVKRLLIRSGVPMVALGPHDTVGTAMQHMARARSGLRRGQAPSAA